MSINRTEDAFLDNENGTHPYNNGTIHYHNENTNSTEDSHAGRGEDGVGDRDGHNDGGNDGNLRQDRDGDGNEDGNEDGDNALSGKVAGFPVAIAVPVIVGGVLLIILIIALICCCCRKKKQTPAATSPDGEQVVSVHSK